ncbi:RagB/SusD family nutrient uptake outer membrane protein [Pedobacter sp. KBS0701]|uniref:RagB/SusD family nutrient uptake outer membrane protein n=1 Tax=Pedobacter sp. KBS0701 TaxID=2578106 RepID=UPI00110F22F3|nr:RagB/SusD family nutrient uptake outer membrane protein [Pedobacter sp. KBS0701]QDW24788.1 RagB/SusD family nutrient uptake outer membrane protein [Pedobacter sp. KBS0701]
MKKNKIIYVLVSLVVLSASCKDSFLEEKKDYAGFNEQVFQEASLAQGYVDYVYGMFLPANNGTPNVQVQSATDNGTYSSAFTQTTDELAGETDWNKEWAQISYVNSNALKYFGQRLPNSVANNTWTRMKEINLFLQEIDKHGLTTDVTNKFKGQMYFWRAWQYFELVKLYGGVPLLLTPQDPIVSSGPANEIQRSSSSACIEQIVKDLDLAISLLPGKWAGVDNGRITSGAAAALKGRVLLTWASPLFNRTDDRARWDRAYQANLAAKTLLESNGFGLYKVGGTANGVAWGNMFTADNSIESVFAFGFNALTIGNPQKNNGWEQATRSREINGAGSISPTKQIVDAFPMRDGKPITASSSTYPYSDAKFYKNRDPRFYKTFVYNGAIWPYSGATNYKQWTYVWKKTATAGYNGTTETKGANASGIYLCKANNPNANNSIGNFSNSPTDYMEIRFAEVVLNLAESAIGTDKLSEGFDGIKSIRDRAGILAGTDGSYGIGNGLSRDQLFAAVLNERKIEFAYESKRFWDLRRWMLFESGATTARLGFAPLNGTRRTGFYIGVKTTAGADYVGANDPLLKPATGTAPLIDRDPATYPAGITTYDQYLDYLYDNYFKVSVRDDLDKTSPANWKFTWYPQYYFFGINQTVLSASPYLQQTTGWDSINGAGTFDPLK